MSIKKPSWGIKEVIIVYLGILVGGLFFGIFGNDLLNYLAQVINIPDNDLGYFILSFVFQFIITVALVLLLTGGRYRSLGIRNVSVKLYVKYGLLGGIALLIIIALSGLLIQHFRPDLQPQTYEEMLRSAKEMSSFVIVFIIGAVLAPLSEELFYRGMMYPVFRNYLGPFGGAVVAGAVFGMSHWDLWRTIPLAVGGAVLCYIYEKTGSIFVSALAHGIWNGTMSVIIYLSL